MLPFLIVINLIMIKIYQIDFITINKSNSYNN